MPRNLLADTRTVDFLELMGNGKLYGVPPYQRDYSWEVEHWEELWEDILEMFGKPDDRHYMGALVVEAGEGNRTSIIDGQQRLATLSILALAVIKRLGLLAESGVDSERNRARAMELRKRFIGEKDPASLIESSKLLLNENDDGFYQDYLVPLEVPLNPRSLIQGRRI